MSTVDRAEFRLGFIWKISAWFLRWEKAKDCGEEFWHQIRETKQTWKNTNILAFVPIIALATLEAVSLQLNGMLIMWKIQQARQDDTIRSIRIHPTFILVTRLTVISVWKNEDIGNWASPLSHVNTSKIYKGFRGKTEISWSGPTGLTWRGPNTRKLIYT